MYIEGKNAVISAIKNQITINKILVDKNFSSRKDEIISLARQNKIKIEFLPRNILDKKSQTFHHQGYIAESVDFEYSSLDDILNKAKSKNETPFIVILDCLQDPHNFGAIIRSCECAGVHGIIIDKDWQVQVNETVIITIAGAVSNMLIARVTNLKEAIKKLQDNDVWIYGTDASGENVYNSSCNQSIALIIGSEGDGIRKTILEKCDKVLSLEMKGTVNSLNASVACGVFLFEILRQRSLKWTMKNL